MQRLGSEREHKVIEWLELGKDQMERSEKEA